MQRLARLWRRTTFDCNSQGLIDYLRTRGHDKAAADLEDLMQLLKGD